MGAKALITREGCARLRKVLLKAAEHGYMNADFWDIYPRNSVRNTSEKLRREGRIFSAQVGIASRYFDTQAKADACLAVYQRKHTPVRKDNRPCINKPASSRAVWASSAPMVFTSATKYTICPPMPQPTKTNTYASI